MERDAIRLRPAALIVSELPEELMLGASVLPRRIRQPSS